MISEAPELSEAVVAAASRIRLLILDVDGVLTDGRLWCGTEGEVFKPFHARDGLGLKLLRSEGIEVAIISGKDSPPLRTRLKALQIGHFKLGCSDKRPALAELLSTLKVRAQEVAYVGDDVIDLPAMREVALPIAVADAHFMVREEALWTTSIGGGKGAVREICDGLLHAQGSLGRAVERLSAPGPADA